MTLAERAAPKLNAANEVIEAARNARRTLLHLAPLGDATVRGFAEAEAAALDRALARYDAAQADD